MDEEKQTECIIPQNYKGITNFLSLTFKTRNLVEGVIIGLILAVIAGSITVYYEYGFTVNVITITIITFGLGALLGVHGCNGESFSEFIVHFLKYLRNRRVTYYNPRVKTEAKPLISADGTEQSSENMLPREKILAIVKKVVDPIKNKHGDTNLEQNEFDENLYEFYDDTAIVSEEPQEKQSAFSRWKAKRRARKMEKERRKMERRIKKGHVKKTKRKPAGAR